MPKVKSYFNLAKISLFEYGSSQYEAPIREMVRSGGFNFEESRFDELLDTPNLGPAYGTRVMVIQNGNWRIAHYNLSIPIPNTIADTIVNQIDESTSNNEQ